MTQTLHDDLHGPFLPPISNFVIMEDPSMYSLFGTNNLSFKSLNLSLKCLVLKCDKSKHIFLNFFYTSDFQENNKINIHLVLINFFPLKLNMSM